jgi:Fe-S-cluster containining protein
MDGLRFECVPGCTNCCRVQGWVYITETNVRETAAFLKLTVEEFEARYVVRTKYTLRLRKPPGSQCFFLENGGCSIHPVKPVQCRTFPFWPELVENRKEWKEAGRNCPGIGKGPLIQIGDAVERANEMRTAYPTHYR